MRRQGKTIRSEGAYRIIEVVEQYLDGSEGVIGYNVIGPGVDGSWLHSRDDANRLVDELLEAESSPRPSPGQ